MVFQMEKNAAPSEAMANRHTGKFTLYLSGYYYYSYLRQTRIVDDLFDTISNPTLIIEILLPSTANYYKGIKFDLYRKILR